MSVKTTSKTPYQRGGSKQCQKLYNQFFLWCKTKNLDNKI